MDSITHILSSIDTFSKSIFKFSQFIDLFKLLKSFPDSISFELNNSDFIHHLSKAQYHLDHLTEFFDSNINPLLTKELHKLKISKPADKMIPYADFTIDMLPVFKDIEPQQLSFQDIMKKAIDDGKPIKQVKRRNDEFSFQGTCPFCGAPHEYIYDNNGKGQFKCKACKNTFTVKTNVSGSSGIYCPHCGCKLSKHHDRKGYIVYICQSKKCPYYKQNKKLFNDGKAEHLKTSSDQYRFHYSYREFKFNLDSLKKAQSNCDSPVNLSKIHFDSNVLGLILTYYVNYGLSSRKTSLILKQVHGLKISHQTVLNYAASVSKIIKPLIDNYPYKLLHILCGDETYIKVRGKNHYVFFWSDPKTKIITSYTIYPVRDTECACRSILDSLKHYEQIPDDLLLITDGNPIYNAAQLFFELNGINFDLQQVIGVKNKDEVSKQFRPYKQIEERLNRTYKQNYYGTNGYDKLDCANNYMVLFVAFFNFLRQHSALNFNTPVNDGLFNDSDLMQDRWIKLIEYSYQYHQA